TAFLLDDLDSAIAQAGPETVALVVMEPVQNAGGAFTPPAGYWRGVREKYDIRPDLITSAKGLSSAYASIGAVIAADHVIEPFMSETAMYSHGITFGGHPVQCAIALKNIEILKR